MTRPTLRRLLPLVGILACPPLWPAPAAAFTPAEAAAPMSVTLVRSDAPDCGTDCPEWLALTGAITPATPGLLAAALARIGSRHLPVLVDSPGGAVEAAMAMGRAIRARKLDVVVAGTALGDCAPADRACAARRRAGERPGFVAGGIAVCASACALLLAAGTDRVVGENSFVGVHQMSAKRTFTQVRTLFRVLRRREGGRLVEVSRTPISTQTLSSRTVQTRAPETLYSEVDRYLLGLGVKDAIMAMMRSAPPTGIHWMTHAELAETRLSTDTTDARTLVARSVAPALSRSAMALASASLGPESHAVGIVDWRVDRAAVGGPALVGTIDVPEPHLHGTVTLRRETDPGATIGYAMAVDFGPPTAIEAGRTWTSAAPRLCDATICYLPFTPAAARDDGQGRREFGVIPAWGDTLLAALRNRSWISIGLSDAEGRTGAVTLSLLQGARGVIAEWEHLCCGLAAPADAAPADPAPAASAPAARARVSIDGGAGAPPRTGEADLPWSASGPDALRATLAVPATDVALSLAVSAAGPGRLALDVGLPAGVKDFGPARAISVPPVRSPGGPVALLAAPSGTAPGGRGFHAVLTMGEDAPEGAALALSLADQRGRTIALTLPIDGPLRVLLGTRRGRAHPAT